MSYESEANVVPSMVGIYRGTSLMRNTPLLGPYSKTTPGVLWWPYGGGLFLMSEVPLQGRQEVEASRGVE